MAMRARSLAVALFFIASFAVAQQQSYVPGQVLVRFRAAAGVSARSVAHHRVNARVLRTYERPADLQLVELPPEVSVEQALQAYRSQPDVLYAEPNYLRQSFDIFPNDPSYNLQWALQNISAPGKDIHAPQAWTITTGSKDVVVAIIDTGIDYTHPDLAANMWRNEADCNANGIDDDPDGYIDDCYGIDLVNHDSDPMDDNRHGSHVAGIIGAVGNNQVGIAGVNWNVRMMACKFLNSSGSGSDANALACLDYVAKLKDRGVNIVATSNSWGGGAASQALHDAIAAQMQRGILFVAAAGNSYANADFSPSYPAAFDLPNIISVAASDSYDAKASFSNYGLHSVHLAAPGVGIYSTLPNNSYGSLSGTSMACPHVTGVVALLKAQDPNRDWRALKNLILTGGDSSTVPTISGRRLNAYGSMTCTDAEIVAVLRPSAAVLTPRSGSGVSFSVLHIRCDRPGGATQFTDPDGTVIDLHDDGVAPDDAAGDGIYSGTWTPSAPGTYSLSGPAGSKIPVIVDLNYFPEPTAYSYRDITGQKLTLDSLNPAVLTDLPFPVLFAGHPFDHLYVYANGLLAVSPGGSTTFSQQIPSTNTSTFIAPMWQLLSAYNSVYWDVIGTAPNRELVVEWRNVLPAASACTPDGAMKFQVVFFESKPDILFNYNRVALGAGCAAYDRGSMATVGIQIGPDLANELYWQSPVLTDQSAILWKLKPYPNTYPRVTALGNAQMAYHSSTNLLVSGNNFQKDAQILISGVPQPTTSIYAGTMLQAASPALNATQPAVLDIAVMNPGENGGPSNALKLKIVPQSFSVIATGTLTVKSGASGTLQLIVYPQNGPFEEAITFSCSNLPQFASCSFSPNQVTPGTGYPSVVMTFNTAATTGATTGAGTGAGTAVAQNVQASRQNSLRQNSLPCFRDSALPCASASYPTPIVSAASSPTISLAAASSPAISLAARIVSPALLLLPLLVVAAGRDRRRRKRLSAGRGHRRGKRLSRTLAPKRRSRTLAPALVLLGLLAIGAGMIACGGGSSSSNSFATVTPPPPPPPQVSSTPPGTYAFQIVGAAKSMTYSRTVSVTVQ